jgi:hypothetical protein
MVGTHNFPALIRQLQSELDAEEAARESARNRDEVGEGGEVGDGWQMRAHQRAHEIVRGRLESPLELLDWAKQDRHWSFTLAEVMREVCAKPSELAARLLIAIIEELREERQTVQSLSE